MKKADSTIEFTAASKWGAAATGGYKGFQLVPDILLRSQHQLGITNTELTVVLNVTLHWWKAENLPHPRPSTIAHRMGVNTRTVERAIASLKKKGLVERMQPELNKDGLFIRRFDLSGLVNKVKAIATDSVVSSETPTQ